VRTLRDFVAGVVTYDPMADVALAKEKYGIDLINELPQGPFDAVIVAVNHVAVNHAPIARLGETGIKALLAPGALIYDLKGILQLTSVTFGFSLSARSLGFVGHVSAPSKKGSACAEGLMAYLGRSTRTADRPAKVAFLVGTAP